MKFQEIIHVKDYFVKAGEKVNLKKYPTQYTGTSLSKRASQKLLEEGRQQLADIQDKLYAHNKYGVLIVLQGMDAAGKDSAVKHIMSGFNPQGVKVYSFKTPSHHELDHNYIWRHYLKLPARGEISIFNRSHYENVLITKVHPEFVLNERIPGVDTVNKIDKDFWKKRYKQINRFEKNLVQNGTVVLKFFLHLSKQAQKKRFLERIDDPAKNWKFSIQDLNERQFWEDYQHAYEDALSETSKPHAPWFIIPADDKWFARLVIASIIHDQFQQLELHYPIVGQAQKEKLKIARQQLENEEATNPKKKENRKAKSSRKPRK